MKYFGTDGIRQPAELFTTDFLIKIIKGLLDYTGNNIKVLLGGDTRESTEWILADLEAALETFGVESENVGVLPTPAINYCFYHRGFDIAIDVTASHNPYTDNGIKIFERGKTSGIKLCEAGQIKIEEALDSDFTCNLKTLELKDDLSKENLALYLDHLKNYLGNVDFSNLKIGLDCANGATSIINQTIFEDLGAKVTLIHSNQKYNTDINQACGSTHLESLQSLVLENSLDLGIAFDGDGDRCLLVDQNGETVDGDEIIAIIANYLNLDQIAVTVMANQGLLNWAKENHIDVEITAVGDSNVAAAMQEKQIQLGGEQSGHIILPNEATGDGLLTSLMILKIISETKTPLHKLKRIMQKSPQIVLNLPATTEQKQSLKTNPTAKNLLLDYSKKLEAEDGRLLVRPSGTEPLIRITMWGNDESAITNLANQLKDELSKTLS